MVTKYKGYVLLGNKIQLFESVISFHNPLHLCVWWWECRERVQGTTLGDGGWLLLADIHSVECVSGEAVSVIYLFFSQRFVLLMPLRHSSSLGRPHSRKERCKPTSLFGRVNSSDFCVWSSQYRLKLHEFHIQVKLNAVMIPVCICLLRF